MWKTTICIILDVDLDICDTLGLPVLVLLCYKGWHKPWHLSYVTTGCPSSLDMCSYCLENMRFVCYSSGLLMYHGDDPAIPPIWFISADQQHNVFTDVIKYT